jgi:hypothetical protein
VVGWLFFFFFFFETRSCYVSQAGLELFNPSASVKWSAGITDMHCHTRWGVWQV